VTGSRLRFVRGIEQEHCARAHSSCSSSSVTTRRHLFLSSPQFLGAALCAVFAPATILVLRALGFLRRRTNTHFWRCCHVYWGTVAHRDKHSPRWQRVIRIRVLPSSSKTTVVFRCSICVAAARNGDCA